MNKFLPLIMAIMLALPVLAQKSAKERQQAAHDERQVGAEAPGKNIRFPAAASRNQPFNFTSHRAPRQKNTRVLMQQMDNYVYQVYDASTSSWINNYKYEFAYDGSGNNTRSIGYYWNPDTDVYEIFGKEEFTYMNGNLTEKVDYDWDADENIYLQTFKRTYDYNGDGDMTTAYINFWNGSAWELAVKDERTYDAAGNMLQQIQSWWNPAGTEWNNSIMVENSYNGVGALLVSTSSNWDLIIEDWLNSNKNEYTYNGSGQLTTIAYSVFHAGSSQWVNNFKEDFTYDGNMNMVMLLASELINNQWFNFHKSDQAYNNTYTSNDVVLPWMFVDESGMLGWMPVHMLTSTTDYNNTGGVFELTGRSQYNYSQVNLTAIAEPENSKARIYPQPATDWVTFGWDGNQPAPELEIYNLNGKKVLIQQLDNQGSVNIGHLKPGLYFYRLLGNNQAVNSGKLSVR